MTRTRRAATTRSGIGVKRSPRAELPSQALFLPPYPPSWVDRFIGWVERLPGPAWVFYLLSGLVLVVAVSIVQARQGAYVASGYRRAHAVVALQPVLALAVIHHLDRAASRSFDRFRTALHREGIDEREALWRLTHLPSRPTLLASLAGVLFPLALAALSPDPAPLFGLAPTQISFLSFLVIMLLIWIVYAPLIYHTIHQLRWVRTLHARYTVIDPYDLEPLYAFAGLTARTALALVALNYSWQFVYPSPTSNPVNIAFTIFFGVLAAAVFAWPLWGIHRLLAEEKARLLTDCARRMKVAVAELRRRIDSSQIKAMDDLNKTMASLEIERSALTRIPTWPWPPGLFRNLVAALLLPVIIWLIQYVLQRLLG